MASRKNLEMFKALCGEEALNNVVLATTYWDSVSQGQGEERESELSNTRNLFQGMIGNGAKLMRHDRGTESAQGIVDYLLPKTPVAPKIMQELQQGKTIKDTAAGSMLVEQIEKSMIKYQAEMAELKQEVTEAIVNKDESLKQELVLEQQALQRKIDKVRVDHKFLMDEVVQKSRALTSTRISSREFEKKRRAELQLELKALTSQLDEMLQVKSTQDQALTTESESSNVLNTYHDDIIRQSRIYHNTSKESKASQKDVVVEKAVELQAKAKEVLVRQEHLTNSEKKYSLHQLQTNDSSQSTKSESFAAEQIRKGSVRQQGKQHVYSRDEKGSEWKAEETSNSVEKGISHSKETSTVHLSTQKTELASSHHVQSIETKSQKNSETINANYKLHLQQLENEKDLGKLELEELDLDIVGVQGDAVTQMSELLRLEELIIKSREELRILEEKVENHQILSGRDVHDGFATFDSGVEVVLRGSADLSVPRNEHLGRLVYVHDVYKV